MGRSKNYGRLVDGVLILNKSMGMTSNKALQEAKRLFFANKAGHTGSLDPSATGVLPLCFGEATKFSQFLLNADKRYRSTVRLGMATTTADAEGEVISQADASHLTAADVKTALVPFRGDIMQIPPMVSALKHQGQPLYKLARAGVEVERPARPVTLYELRLLGFRPGEVAEALSLPGATLSFHLKELAAAGLIEGEAHGRNISYRADFAAMNGLIDFLTHNCCAGDESRCLPAPRPVPKGTRASGA